MKNIFENAYFGKAYKTKDGKKVIYWRHSYRHHLFTESGLMECDDNGKFFSRCPDLNTLLDIVGEWEEEVDEEKLDKLAEENCPYCDFAYDCGECTLCEDDTARDGYINGFKDGYRYRKAKEGK